MPNATALTGRVAIAEPGLSSRERVLAAVAAYERTLRLVHADAAVRQTRIPEPGQSIR